MSTYSVNDIAAILVLGILTGIYLWHNPSAGDTVLLPIATGIFGYMRGRQTTPTG